MDKYTVSPETFAAQMDLIWAWGWQPVSLEEALAGDAPSDGRRPLVITFDDGFASNKDHAWPILAERRFPSETFIVTGCIGLRNLWDGESRDNYPVLSAYEIAGADPELVRFHSHSQSHPDLTFITQDPEAMSRELEEPLAHMSSFTTAGRYFAYPRGSWNWPVMRRVREAGYAAACTCLEGLNSPRTDPYLLRRTEITEADLGLKLRLKITSGRNFFRWPMERPAEVSILAAWVKSRLKPRALAA